MASVDVSGQALTLGSVDVNPFRLSLTVESVALVLEAVDIRADSYLGIGGCVWADSHLGICGSEGCGFPNQVKREPLHHLPVLMVHDVHHFSLQSH